MKRSGKFYRKNEKEVMEMLGFEPTYNSGSGWIEKEDGQTDYLIAQLKSTDAQSIKVNQKDLRMLENNAVVAHKLPVFIIQFLNTGELWLLTKPYELPMVAKYMETGEMERLYNQEFDVEDKQSDIPVKIKSSGNAREQFHNELNAKYDKTKSAR